jgi:hypothetical protein
MFHIAGINSTLHDKVINEHLFCLTVNMILQFKREENSCQIYMYYFE